MREKANRKFKSERTNIAKILPPQLESILLKGFNRCGEVVFAAGLAAPSVGNAINQLKYESDFTGIECNLNKIHIEDYIPKNTNYDHNMIISYGLLFTRLMASAISLKFSEEPFRFILAEEEGEFPSVVFRFHKKRIGESWLADDIESYESGIFLLDTD